MVPIDRYVREGDSWPIVTVRADDGSEVAVHAFRAVLRGELAKLRPEPGERIEVTFQGERELARDCGDELRDLPSTDVTQDRRTLASLRDRPLPLPPDFRDRPTLAKMR